MDEKTPKEILDELPDKFDDMYSWVPEDYNFEKGEYENA